jgi:uncharacterized membrane protein YfcA
VGTSLFKILFTCIEVTFLQTYTNHNAAFYPGGAAALGLDGGRPSRRCLREETEGEQLKILLAIIVLVVMVKFIFE